MDSITKAKYPGGNWQAFVFHIYEYFFALFRSKTSRKCFGVEHIEWKTLLERSFGVAYIHVYSVDSQYDNCFTIRFIFL